MDNKAEKAEKVKDVKFKKVPGRITIIQALPYKGCHIYIRQVDKVIFEYLVVFDGQLYSSYVIIDLKEKKTISRKQVISMGAFMFTAACTTVDELIRLKIQSITQAPVKRVKQQPNKRLNA